METSLNFTTNNGTTDDVNFDVPLYATYFNLSFLLVAIPSITVPAVLVIRIILKTTRLHTIYYLFVVNLLITNILNTCKMGFETILMCLYLFGVNADTTASFIIYSILSIPRLAARFSFINLAIDRAIAIAFPYHHKNIMTTKRAYIMLAVIWIISSINTAAIFSASFRFVGPLGTYTPIEKPTEGAILFVFILVLTVILILSVNVYLYAQINQSRKKLEENMSTHGTRDDDEKIKLKRTYRRFQKLIKTTVSLLVLGGVDGMINLLTLTTVIVMNRLLSVSVTLYALQFVVYPLLCVQLMSHSLGYGVYMKDFRKKLCKCYLCQKLKRMLPLRPSKVTVLNQP